MISNFAIGINATEAGAWVNTFLIFACLVIRTVLIE